VRILRAILRKGEQFRAKQEANNPSVKLDLAFSNTSLMARPVCNAYPCNRTIAPGVVRVNGEWEVSMRQLSAAVVVLLLSCGAAAAQTMSTTPIPPASPLGIPGTIGAIGSTPSTGSTGMARSSAGIGLGATGIDPGGLSPAVSPNCNLGSSSSGMASTGMSASGAGAAFDGGGMSGTGSAGITSGSCATGSVGSTAVGTALSPSSPGSAAGSIPLGATELNNAGVSPMIGVPAPSIGLPAPGTTMGGATGLGLPGTSSMSTGGSSTGF
jgi:hypothetical protein